MSSQPRLHLFDGLRGFAAISVLMYHVHNGFGTGHWFQSGYLAVDLFFLLSGFILTVIAEPRMAQGLSAEAFFRARIRRLWPMIALGTIVGAAVQFGISDVSNTGLAIAALLGFMLIPTLGRSGEIYPLNGPQWSLLWELVANLAHGAIFARLSTRALTGIAAISGAGLFAAIVLRGGNTFGPLDDYWWLGAIRVLFSYCTGIVIARVIRNRELPPLAAWWFALAAPFIVIIALPFLPVPAGVADAVIVTMMFPALFWLAVRSTPPPAWAAVWMDRLGAVSFPLYGVHAPLVLLFSQQGSGTLSAAMAVVASLVLAAVIAWLGGWMRKRLRRPSSQQAMLQSA